MRIYFFSLLLLIFPLTSNALVNYTDYTNVLFEHYKIVDIASDDECKKNGKLHDSIHIELFDYKHRYNIKTFLAKLRSNINMHIPFVISGNSEEDNYSLAKYLHDTYNLNVILLDGGLLHQIEKHNIKMDICN